MTLFPQGRGGRMDAWMDGWMDERINGRVTFEYLLLTDWRSPTWQAETGGSWGAAAGWGRERNRARGELWMDGPGWRGRRGCLARACSPTDRQAASWWSHLATQSQPEMMGPSLRLQCTVALFQRPLGWLQATGVHRGERRCLLRSGK